VNPMEFTAPEEVATYGMLQQVLHNHLTTTALCGEEALNMILDLFCELCALLYADICQAPGPVQDEDGMTRDVCDSAAVRSTRPLFESNTATR